MSEFIAAHFWCKSRSVPALRASAVHLLLSVLVAGVIAALVFRLWYPSPLRELVGGTDLFWLIVKVDVVCGPLLTLVVFNPMKPRAELRRDLTLVAFIQLLALGYGIHTLAYARPVALVYEVDRFRVVTYSDLAQGEDAHVPDWAQPWRLEQARTIGLRPANTLEEQLGSIEASLQGIEPSQRASRWQDYALSKINVLDRAHPLSELRGKHDRQAAVIDSAVSRALANSEPGEANDGAALLWLPMVSQRATDWVVLIDPHSARPRAYIHLNGFFN